MKHDPFNSKLLFYWVNSLDIPRCLLASSTDDFRDGIIFNDMVCKLKYGATIPTEYDLEGNLDRSIKYDSLLH